ASSRTRGIVYVREDRLGLSHARNRGILEARGELIAFIDDDALAEKEWLTELTAVFDDSSIACAGGLVLPAWQERTAWPQWLHPRLYCFYSTITEPAPREMHYPSYPVGTNIAFRKSALANAGIFNLQLGRIGDSLLSMEEVDI